jgi:speckle-type POZ protein
VIDYKFKAYENGILRSIRHISEEPNKLKWRGKINDCNWPISSLVFDCYIELYRSVNVSLKIVDDFEKLLETNKFHDVILNCSTGSSEKEFKAHKAILSVRSPVFQAMFENDLEEAKNNVVRISDIDPVVLKDLLSFIYCGKITNFENSCDLFVAADKYQIEDLMDYCHRWLLNNINEHNLIHCLRLAETYNKKELKENAIEFFIKNESKMTNLMENKDWKDMVSDCPGLANEIMRAFFAKLNRNTGSKSVFI